MSKTTVQNGRIELLRFVDNAAGEHVRTCAVLPECMRADWEGCEVKLLDWKIDPEKQTAKLEYQTHDDPWAAIMDCELPVEQTRVKLEPPGRSKHWKWDGNWGYWRNSRTGEKVEVW